MFGNKRLSEEFSPPDFGGCPFIYKIVRYFYKIIKNKSQTVKKGKIAFTLWNEQQLIIIYCWLITVNEALLMETKD